MGQKDEDEDDKVSDGSPDGDGAQGDDADEDERDDADEQEDSDESDESDESASDEDESDEDESDEDEPAAAAGDEGSEEEPSETALAARGSDALAEGDDEEEELPTQLGSSRFVFGAFFTGGIIAAFVLGKSIHGLWAHFANRDFVVDKLPMLAAVTDEAKETYSMVLGAVIALFLTFRTYRRQRVKDWSSAVSAELVKVKWPNRKEVQASTIVVLATSAVATAYLFLLDRFWGFVTDLVYGSGGS
jgi:preprotein translocase subunit SecE